MMWLSWQAAILLPPCSPEVINEIRRMAGQARWLAYELPPGADRDKLLEVAKDLDDRAAVARRRESGYDPAMLAAD